jgi:ABC-2 type transport system permease protein
MSTVWRLELAQLTRSWLVRGVLVAFALLIVFALWVGLQERERWSSAVSATRSETERVLAREQENIRLQRQEGSNPPGTPSAQAMDATLPPAPGVVLAVGDASERPISATINTSSRVDTFFKNAETGSALSASLGALDLTWVAIVLMPLLVIALTHDLIAAERDAARLGLLRAQSRTLGNLIARRLTVRLSLPLLLMAVAALAALMSGVAAQVVMWWWLIASAYLLLWGVVAAVVSVRANTAQSSAAILLLAWLAFVVLLPSGIALAAERFAPVPSRLSQVIAMRDVQLGLQQRTAELLDRYLMDHPELAGASRSGFARSSFVAQRETEAMLAPVIARFAQARGQQAEWLGVLSWLSPSMLTHSKLIHLAGTDGARHGAFVHQAGEFAAQWREHLRDRLFLDRTLSPEEVATLPRFEFEEPASTSPAASTLAYLLVLIGVTVMLLRLSLSRVEVR